MEEKIKARIEELKAKRDEAIKEIQAEADRILGPFNAAIAELEALIREETSFDEGIKELDALNEKPNEE